MEPTTIDAKTDSISSTESPSQAKTESSSEFSAENSMADVAKAVFERSQAQSDEKEEAKSDVQELDPTSEGDKKSEGEVEDAPEEKTQEPAEETVEEKKEVEEETETVEEEKATEDEVKNAEKENPPFHNHPRWKEQLQKTKSIEERAIKAESELQAVKPQLDEWKHHSDFVERYSIQPRDVAEAMEFLALSRVNPMKALEKLQTIQRSLVEFDPNALSPKLRKDVTEGLISEDYARQLHQAEIERRVNQRKQETATEAAKRNLAFENNRTMLDWDKNMRAKDLDFRPKASADAPDGKWEIAAQKFAYLMTQNFAETPEQLIKTLTESYNSADQLFKTRLAPKLKPTVKQLSSSKSSTKPPGEPKTVRDVVRSVAAKHGIRF
jgi:hypothetical protein